MGDEIDFNFPGLNGDKVDWDIDIEQFQTNPNVQIKFRKKMEELRAKRYGVDGKMDGP